MGRRKNTTPANRKNNTPAASTPSTPLWRSTFVIALAGGGLLWAAFAPLQWYWLAWLAPVCWLVLVRAKTLAGRHPYRAMWVASAIFWLTMLWGITRAHWLNHFGWIALSLYLAAYLPGFVALTRLAVHRYRIPIIFAAPLVWTGLELLRGRLFTGFAVGLLSHTQTEWTRLIQISDLFGAYGVSFVVMLVAASLARMLPIDNERRAIWPVAPLIVVLVATLGYGHMRMASAPTISPTADKTSSGSSASAPLKVALIQRVVDTTFETDPDRNLDTFDQYWQATLQARKQHPDLELIIWPESVFSENTPEIQRDDNFLLPDDVRLSREEFSQRFKQREAAFDKKLEEVANGTNQLWQNGAFETLDIYLLVGTETIHFGSEKINLYNSALLINPSGQIVDRYYKMHPVMFGEYIPLGSWIPFIYQLAPMAQGITPGERPEAFQLAGKTLAPSICFESCVPHLIRQQVVALAEQGSSPEILVNITHDGWFFGTSILELQFTGSVFRAVELRRPMLVAANAGISCWIDGSGKIRARGPRRSADVIVAEVQPDGRWSGYALWGDFPLAAVCLIGCFLLFAAEFRGKSANRAKRDTDRE